MPSRSSSGVVVLFLILLAAGRGESPPAPAKPDAVAHVAIHGSASCAGHGCHGSTAQPDPEGGDTWKRSSMLWLHDDPHAEAFAVLDKELGKAMGKVLKIQPPTDPRCLACHANPQSAHDPDKARDGVSCEACHGPATKWVVPHRQKAFLDLRDNPKDYDKRKKKYESHGMNFLPDLTVRAEVCAGCHIGAPADPEKGIPLREVTHEMYAAGHPRLMFEFGAFLANLPRHWNEKADFRRQEQMPEREARVWAVGQAVSAEANWKLIADQARRAKASDAVEWPEYAQFDCFACHQGLGRKGGGFDRASLGFAPWYFTLLPILGDKASQQTAVKRRYPGADAAQTEAKTGLASVAGLAAKMNTMPINNATLAGWRAKLLDHAAKVSKRPNPSWDDLEQVALALRAIGDAEKAMGGSGREKALEQLFQLLAFPRLVGEKKVNSPLGFRADDKFFTDLATSLKGLR